MSRAANLLFVTICWGAIYLPALGSLEIKGEEGRRILPAIAMLETGQWLVPQVGSEPYYRKPPLVNWLVASSFSLTGYRNEWTARLPSALSVLAVALAFILVARSSLGPKGSFAAALIWLANFGMIEKGRLIEIEALYVSVFGLAIICWLHCFVRERSPWITWIVPSAFLGLGLLAKGPVHLFFFYAVVVAVLYRAGQVRKLWHPAHALGILLMLGIFAAWAIPVWRATTTTNLAQTWAIQLTGRLTGADFRIGSWLQNIPRGLAYFLPWTLLFPLVTGAQFPSTGQTNLQRGLILGCAVPFLVINLLPGALPRYSMPVLVPASWLMAMTLVEGEIRQPNWWPGRVFPSAQGRSKLVIRTAIVAVVAIGIYALALVPFLQRRSKVKSIATQINLLVPDSEPLYAIDPDYQPFLFYVRSRLIYASRIDDLPIGARFVLVQSESEQALMTSERWAPRYAHPLLRTTDYRNRTVVLAKVSE
jgi:4-amino-4-deoxy-L-arabinose transferase-like glycosyltransferase